MLKAALHDVQRGIQTEATIALGRLGDSSVVESLIQILDQASVPRRRDAILALGGLRDPRAFGPLVETQQNEVSHYFLRLSAAQALGRLGDPRALPILIAALQDRHAWVRQAAIESLAALGDPAAIGPLEAMLQSHDSFERTAAETALRQLKGSDRA